MLIISRKEKIFIKCSICKKTKHKKNFPIYQLNTYHYYCKVCSSIKRKKKGFNLSERYYKYKYRAKEKGLAFKINQKEFDNITKQECVYCGKYSHNDKKITGVDRINSNIGYIINNCVPCCYKCNTMKNDMSQQDFFDHVNDIFKYKEKNNGQTTNIQSNS